MLLSIIQCTGQPPTEENYQTPEDPCAHSSLRSTTPGWSQIMVPLLPITTQSPWNAAAPSKKN